MENKRNIRLGLKVNERENEMLEVLAEKYGAGKLEFIRQLIRQAFDKEYGGYKGKLLNPGKESIKVKKLTTQQLCEKHGGHLRMENGAYVCDMRLKGTQSGRSFPMSMEKEIINYGENNVLG